MLKETISIGTKKVICWTPSNIIEHKRLLRHLNMKGVELKFNGTFTNGRNIKGYKTWKSDGNLLTFHFVK